MDALARAGVGALRALGFGGAVAPATPCSELMNMKTGRWRGYSLQELVLHAWFGDFVLVWPGPWQRKRWFVLAGSGKATNIGLLVRRAAVPLCTHESSSTNPPVGFWKSTT